MKMKKFLALALAVVMMLGALAGCGGKKDDGPADGEVELTVWAWDVALMQLQDAAAEYQKTHPDVKFVFEEMGTEQIYNKLSTSLATGNGIADIIAIEGGVLVGYADKFPEGFLDVTDCINPDDFLGSKVAEVQYKGKTHGFPWDAGPVGMFYRTDYFEQAGVKAEDIKTWDDLIEAGKKIEAVCKTPAGNPVKMLPCDPNRAGLYSTLRGQMGISVFDENGKPQISNPDSLKAMHMYDKIFDSGVVLKYNGWDEYEQTVVNESVACIPEAIWMIGTIKDKGPQTEGKWSAMDLPMIEGGKYDVTNGGSNLTINAKTEFPDAAKDFCKFAMTDTKLQANGFQNYGLYPSFIPSYEEEVFKTGDAFFGEGNVYEVFIENGKNVPNLPVSVNDQEAGDYIGAAISNILLNGADVDQVFADLQAELETKFN